MMGYASLAQTDTGLYMRQRARAFIVAEPNSSERSLFLNADIAMGDSGVRRELLAALAEEYGNTTYHAGNVALVGTHQHSGTWKVRFQFFVYLHTLLRRTRIFFPKGLHAQSLTSIVDGAVLAVRRAHLSLAPGNLSFGTARVEGGSRNRSPTAYLANPADERARYAENGGDGGDQECNMSLLKFGGVVDDGGGIDGRGFLSFFAVHGRNNTLINGDNKGMAAYLYETLVEPRAMPGNTTYVAGFVQGSVGDTSPNTCAVHGRGPAFTEDAYGFASSAEIGARQAMAAGAIVRRETGDGMTPVVGSVRSVHVYVDMSRYGFALGNGTRVRTCPAAMGFSFAGGTTDGPGAFDFVQGDNKTSQNPFWELVKVFVTPSPSEEQVTCQYPKPILLNTGYAHKPYEWSPSTVDVQIFRVGNFVMLIIPGELTTMAGRRIREAVRAELISSGILGSDAHVVVAGTANRYAHYITTREEYAVQRYEGASTLYGPYTLEAYIDKYTSLVPFLADGATGTPPSDPAPAEQLSKAISMQASGTDVKFDAPPLGKHFGQTLQDVRIAAPYKPGETVFARFVGANPRNNLRLEGTYLAVERLESSLWVMMRSDSHPSTVYQWQRDSTILGTSSVNISWTIETDTPPGTYRLRYFGDLKPLVGAISAFVGASSNFTVVAR
ncbi:Neutral/alkaline nonlysosomal ceramidase [Mycena leptocephala]|nr:Neutral/alkaline nonlysosomal ceramidase [Mycena leptocephala]